MSCVTIQPPSGNHRLAKLVAHFQQQRKQTERDDVDCYRKKSSLAQAITSAARAERNDGQRHSHQWRLGDDVITKSERALQAAKASLATCKDFDALHKTVKDALALIPGAGVLFIYDTAFRLGIFLNIHPDKVYLHRGTREGAANLGLPSEKPYLEMSELLPELRIMTPADVEDFLCIYKDSFKRRIN